MAIPLKDLLGKAVNRAHIAKPLAQARLIEETNKYLANNLPLGRRADAKAISFRDGNLTVACLNGAAASFVAERQEEIRDFLKASLPDCSVDKIITKIMAQFPQRDFMVK